MSMIIKMDTSKIPAVAHPKADCVWCWYASHTTPFPEQRSSSCCAEHQVWQLVRLEAKRQQRQVRREVVQG